MLNENFNCCNQAIDMASSVQYYLQVIGDTFGKEMVMPIILGLIVFLALFLALFFKALLVPTAKKDSILLLGLSEAGKTLMLSKLIGHKGIQTVVSLKENVTLYAKDNKTIKLIDLPGSDAIRQKFFDKYKTSARGFVFVIDSANISKDIKEVAEFLYSILTEPTVYKMAPSLLIACNKQDLLAAKSSKAIKTHLEKELTTLRKTRSAALIDISNSTSDEIYLGEKGEGFEFAHLKKITVDFAECNVIGGAEEESRLDEVCKWIESEM